MGADRVTGAAWACGAAVGGGGTGSLDSGGSALDAEETAKRHATAKHDVIAIQRPAPNIDSRGLFFLRRDDKSLKRVNG